MMRSVDRNYGADQANRHRQLADQASNAAVRSAHLVLADMYSVLVERDCEREERPA